MDNFDSIEVKEEELIQIKTEPESKGDRHSFWKEDQYPDCESTKSNVDFESPASELLKLPSEIKKEAALSDLSKQSTEIKKELATPREEEMRMFVQVGVGDSLLGLDDESSCSSSFCENEAPTALQTYEGILGQDDVNCVKSEEIGELTSPNDSLSKSQNESSSLRKEDYKAGSDSANHSKWRTFTCHVCNKCFALKFDLKRHMRIHSGERPFTCHDCNKSFTRKFFLTQHMKLHSGEKPFVCHLCNKRFILHSFLTKHMIIHSNERPVVCQVCNKRFKENFNLAFHMRIHSGEKPFNCHHCNKSFIRKFNLTQHMKIHSGEKPFNCLHCDRGFRRKFHLAVHMKTHSGLEPFKIPELEEPEIPREEGMRMFVQVGVNDSPFGLDNQPSCGISSSKTDPSTVLQDSKSTLGEKGE